MAKIDFVQNVFSFNSENKQMKTVFKMLAIPALLSVSLGVSAAPAVLAFFDGPFQQINAGTDGGRFVSAAEVAAPNVIGGFRDISVNCISGCQDGGGPAGSSGEADIRVVASELRFSTDAGVIGQGVVTWDGPGNTGLGNPGAFDLTMGGTLEAFLVETIESDGGGLAGWSFQITGVDSTGRMTDIDLAATPVNPPADPTLVSTIPFSAFTACGANIPGLVAVTCSGGDGTGARVNDLVSLAVLFNTDGVNDIASTIDLRVAGISTVPTPGALALIGLGLAGMGAVARKRKKSA
jgi:hypothetical protein